jgi:chloride channel 3/4/5
MPPDEEQATERTHLLIRSGSIWDRPRDGHSDDARSILSSHVSKDELALGLMPVGERLPYNDYTTIDWLHDLVAAWLHHWSPRC